MIDHARLEKSTAGRYDRQWRGGAAAGCTLRVCFERQSTERERCSENSDLWRYGNGRSGRAAQMPGGVLRNASDGGRTHAGSAETSEAAADRARGPGEPAAFGGSVEGVRRLFFLP